MSGLLVQTVGMMRRKKGVSLAIGTFSTGGYFTGIIVDGGVRYQVLVSPRQGGDTQNDASPTRKWKTVADTHPGETQTLTNGPAATQAMINAGIASYPAASWANTVRNNNLSGFNDWYIPARDELELCYRNLKPGSVNNNFNNRPVTGFGGDGLKNGLNANSDPSGEGYTTSLPSQTTVPSFQSTTGTECFFTGSYYYWSSTSAEGTLAWRQHFNDGLQVQATKTSNTYVRVVRRVAA